MTRCHSKSVPTSWLCVQLNSLQHFLELSKALARLSHCSARVNRDAVPTVYYNVYHPTAAAAALARHFTDWQLLHWHKWQTVHCSEVARSSKHFVCWAKQSEYINTPINWLEQRTCTAWDHQRIFFLGQKRILATLVSGHTYSLSWQGSTLSMLNIHHSVLTHSLTHLNLTVG